MRAALRRMLDWFKDGFKDADLLDWLDEWFFLGWGGL